MTFTRRAVLQFTSAAALAACTPALHKSHDADVIIIGAGLSGLHAARMLAEDGVRVLVIEGAERAGGRILTLDDVPGSPEAGGQQVGQGYARIRKTAIDLGLAILPYPAAPRDTAYSVGGRTMSSADWTTAKENPLPGPLRSLAPSTAMMAAAARSNPFKDEGGWRNVDPGDDISGEAWLTAEGFSPEARHLMDIGLNGISLDTYSMANLWRTLFIYGTERSLGAPERIEGGSSRLTEAMAASLEDGSLRLKTKVKAIIDDGSRVEVRTDNGSLYAPFVICSLPFAAIRDRVEIKGPISDPHLEARNAAIMGLPYTPIQQIHLLPENRFWEQDGLPLDMWTDGSIERVFGNLDDSGEVTSLTCWVNGLGIHKDWDDAAWFAKAAADLEQMRGAKVRGARVVRWDSSQPLSGGAYMHWAPGQIKAWAKTMALPSGRIHFAGEHTSFQHTGMEGAMESGERAAIEIFERIDSQPA